MKRALVLVVLAAASLAQAQDYLDYKMLATAQRKFSVYVDNRSNSPAGLSQTAVQNAVQRAWDTWNAVTCAYPKVQVIGGSVGTVPNPTQSYDDYSVTPVWMLNNDADAQLVFGVNSFIAAITLPRAYGGVLQTCDIYFNGGTIAWSLDPVTPTGRMDVETVLLHEAGHCLGLGHYGGDTEVMEQVVQDGLAVRALSIVDQQVLCTRYALSGEYGSPCNGDGGCSQADLKCLQQPVTNGLTLNLCTRGCGLGTNAACDLPLTCQPSTSFNGYNGACLLPGTAITQVGKACLDDTTCGNSFAYCQRPQQASGNNQFWLDRYCTQACEPGQPPCPTGSICAQLDIGQRCLSSCRIGYADCRVGYACAQMDSVGTTGVCIPRCYSDQDCANPQTFACQTCDGLCYPRTSAGAIGDACLDSDTCGPFQACRKISDRSAGKFCTISCGRGCGTCPSGSVCVPGARNELFCLKTCNGPGTCPLGLRCGETELGQACVPACASTTECPVGQACINGECVLPVETDGGCTALTCRPDAGRPIVVTPPDAGTGPGGSVGCGCAAVDSSFGFALLGVLAAVSRRRAWRARA